MLAQMLFTCSFQHLIKFCIWQTWRVSRHRIYDIYHTNQPTDPANEDTYIMNKSV